MKLLLLVVAIYIAVLDASSQNNLTEEQQKLAFIAGSWTVDGSEDTYLEICDWIEGNHLQCRSTDTESGTERKSLSYMTYSAAEKVYIYYGLYGGGSTRSLRGKWTDDRFVFEGQQETADKLTRYRVTMKPENGNIDFREERSINNGEWKELTHFQYKPVKI